MNPDSLDALIGALRERGFEVFVSVSMGPTFGARFRVMREILRLTGRGMSEADRAITHEEIILSSLAPEQSERVRERLMAVGGLSNLSFEMAHLYAFVPEHPRRGAQICEQLIVIGQRLELTRGQLGGWGPSEDLPVGEGGLLEAIDRQRARWADAGLGEAGSEVEILRRVSVRDERLEARICAAEPEAAAHEAAVYGDWLQSMGDPRGHAPSSVTEHAVHLFGPARNLIARRCSRCEWIGPMISTLSLAGMTTAPREPAFQLVQLLALPVCAGLRELELRVPFTDHPNPGEVIARSSCAASLRSLCVREAWSLSLVDTKFERLEQLEFSARHIDCMLLSAPVLRRLVLEFSWLPPALEYCFAGLDTPALEHFELALYLSDHWEHELGPLQPQLATVLKLPAFARLRTLTLRTLPGSAPYERGLAQVLERLPARGTLERIDLSRAALVPEARAELEEARSTLPELVLG